MQVFAYGSNMCLGRLRARTPSARVVAVAYLPAHQLRFHKLSTDGSGKADAFPADDPLSVVWGVVFEIDYGEKAALDRAEGLGTGYSERPVDVIGHDGQQLAATMYSAVPDAIDGALRPYSWYLTFVLEGARQHGLPAEYVRFLEGQPARDDPKRSRDAEQRAISC